MATAYEVISVSAQLTVQGTDVRVRTAPVSGTVLKTLNTGTVIQAVARTLINGEPWFAFDGGWISGEYVQGWVKDNNDNNCWWYVKTGYTCPTAMWENISGKDYCFGSDGYLFVECYIKSADKNLYYWVDEDGVYIDSFDTGTPDRSYRVVENYTTENAYRGSVLPTTYSGNVALTNSQMRVNAQYILDYLRGKGWTKNAVCGMLGNMQTESTVNPGRWQAGYGENNMNGGFGLVQWTPASKYFNWAQNNDLPAVYMDSEIERILYEVRTTGEQYIPTSNYNLTFSQFTKSTESAYYLACAFLHNYERPKDSSQDAVRGNQATTWFNSLS